MSAGRGRPTTVPIIERGLGMRLEHYVMAEMAARRSLAQIAAALKLSTDTVRRHLRQRGYRVRRDHRLVKIGPPDQGGAGRRAR